MKVFISWSGEQSNKIAEILNKWIPSVIQAVEPFYSPEDIAKGSRPFNELSQKLDDSNIGILCLTKENINSSWIMFEAGALSKNFGTAKVCPLLFGVKPTDIKGPLAQFQAAEFSEKEMKRLLKMINEELKENSLADEVLTNVFKKW